MQAAVIAFVALLGCGPIASEPAAAQTTQHTASSQALRLYSAVRQLPVARETHENSYDREQDFGDWIAQGNGCDTRAVVLQQESKTPVSQSPACTVQSGRWRSYYNATTYTDAGDLQIDHVVPVKNVWITGGWRWDQATRVAYYNDLEDPRTLVAVDSHDNESKGDQTPDRWLPPEHQCRYIREFAVVKLRWHLTVTRAEKKALKSTSSQCHNVAISFEPAPIGVS